MSFAVALRRPQNRQLSFNAAVKLARNRAVHLGRPTVMTLLSPHAITPKNLSGLGETPAGDTNAWDNTNKALSALTSTIGTGTKFYVDREQTKQLQSQADLAARQTEAAQRAMKLEQQAQAEAQRAAMLAAASNTGMPPWLLPVAIGGVLLAAFGGYFIFKKKAV